MSPIPTSLPSPLPFGFDVEKPEADEAKTTSDLIEAMLSISKTTFEHSGHALRSVHAKSHGLLVGELQVSDDLPDILRQGIFAAPGTYPVVIRLSTPPGDLLADKVSTPRGFAMKVLGVKGGRLEGSESDSTQDFVMINGPAFQVPTAKAFLGNVKLLAKTTDKSPGLKEAASKILRGIEKGLEAVGSESPKIKSMGGHPETNILGETFYTAAPLRYGAYIAKMSIAPASPALKALTDQPLADVDTNPTALRDAVKSYFWSEAAEWELRVQLCTDLKNMPVEDASVIWPEDQSPYIAVARIRVPAQVSWSEARAEVVDDLYSFSPWHGIEDHRPLGSIMRVRKAVYEMSRKFRGEHNGKAVEEPSTVDEIPS